MSIIAILFLILTAILWPRAIKGVLGVALIILLNMAAQAIHDPAPVQIATSSHTSPLDRSGPAFRYSPSDKAHALSPR